MLDDQRFLELERGRIEYAWHGPGPEAAATLVFLHQGLGCAELWRDLPRTLARRTGLGAFVYSRFGYGGSDPNPLPWPVTYMHREALEVLPAILEAAGIRKAILVGHSDGASIAVIHAGGTATGRVLGLVLEAPHVFTEAFLLGRIDEARCCYQNEGLREQLAIFHGDNVDNAFFGWADTWQQPNFLDWNLEAYLSEVRVPILVVQGQDDAYGTLAQARAIEAGAGVPVETLILDDCGHEPHREARDRFLDATERFVVSLL